MILNGKGEDRKKMRKGKRILALVMATTLAGLTACGGNTSAPTAAPEKTEPVMKALENGEVALVKSEGANPIVGNSDKIGRAHV